MSYRTAHPSSVEYLRDLDDRLAHLETPDAIAGPQDLDLPLRLINDDLGIALIVDATLNDAGSVSLNVTNENTGTTKTIWTDA